MKKVSVTLDERLVAQAKRRSRSGGLSAFLNEALRLQLQRDRIGELLDEHERAFGPIPAKVQEEVDAQWDAAFGRKVAPQKSKRRAKPA